MENKVEGDVKKMFGGVRKMIKEILLWLLDKLNIERITKSLGGMIPFPWEKYLKKVIATFEYIKPPSSNKCLTVEEGFVRLKVCEFENPHDIPFSISVEIIKSEKERREKNSMEIANALLKSNKLVILGEPGTGKTTLLEYLTIEYSKKMEKKFIPVFVSLREWDDYYKNPTKGKKCFIDYISSKEPLAKQYRGASKFIEKSLKNGNCIMLIDDFHKVTDNKAKESLITEIKDLNVKIAGTNSKLIVSSRIAGYKDEFQFHPLVFNSKKLIGFEEEGENDFIKKWLIDKSNCDKLMTLIKNHKNLNELSKNPLLLSLIVIYHEKHKSLPKGRIALYEDSINKLLERTNNNPKEMKTIHEIIAFYLHNNGRSWFEIGLLPHMGINYQEDFIQNILINGGLLRQLSVDKFEFSHLTFQEYLTASYVHKNNNFLPIVIEKFANDVSWWNEVIFLLMELKSQ